MAITDEELIKTINSDSFPLESKEMALLIYRYTRIIKIKANKLKSSSIEADDLEQEGFIALLGAVRSYSPERGAFSTFANTCITNRMKNTVQRARSRYEKVEDFDYEQIMDESAVTDEVVILKECNSELFRRISEILSEREYEVLGLYLDGYSYKQIAEKLGVSVKSVDNSLSRTRQKLKSVL